MKGGYIVGGSIVLGGMCLKSGARVRGYVIRDQSAVHTGSCCYNSNRIGVIIRGGSECVLWVGRPSEFNGSGKMGLCRRCC